MNIKFPFTFDRQGRTASSRTVDEHIREMIEETLFTSPSERVNRPDFGCGLMQLVFAPNSAELAAAVQASVHASLQRWLGDLIAVEQLEVESDESTLKVFVRYLILRTSSRKAERFERRLPR